MTNMHKGSFGLLQAAESSGGSKSLPQHNVKLGKKLKDLRQSKGWTLEKAADASGLAASTLSKIENERMSPTFDVVQKLAHGFGIDITALFARGKPPAPQTRRSVIRKGAGRFYDADVYSHEMLATDLVQKKILPFVSVINARSIDEFTEWGGHEGEEFMYVLSGSVRFYTEHYEAVDLETGDGIYIDSEMRHACITTSEKSARVLWINTG